MMLSIVIPSYSEAENLSSLLPELGRVARELTENVEIIVIDTMEPTDNTEEVCRKLGVRYVRRAASDNYGDAIRTGIEVANGTYVIMMDADGSHSAEFIVQLWNQRENADIVIASRFMPGGSTDNPFVLTAMSKMLNFVFRLVTGVTAFDTSNSFRLYNGDLLRSQRLVCQHFDVLQELLVKMTRHDPARVMEIPYHFRERISGRSKRRLLQFSLNYLATLYTLRKSIR
ncbi:MAG: glycosyltransferase [Gammaproteobacteria bacterium]|nr:glycosyltransferase [Gammaproteobacteria bacterium]